MELVIVIGVIAIIASIAVPNYTSFVERMKMKTDVIALKQLKEMSENYRDLNGNYPSMPSETHTNVEEMKSFVDAFYGPLGIEVKADYYILSSTIKGSYGADASGASSGFQADLGGVYITACESQSDS
jgi:type IV pilus assembly protein PilE